MATTITYFVHGTTTDNEAGLATGWLPGELSERGRQQSIELGHTLDPSSFNAVFSSDLERAKISARLMFGSHKAIIADSRLRECNYGDLNGQPASTFKDKLEHYIDAAFPHGESYREVEYRMSAFLDYMRANYAGQHVALVAHQAPQLALDVLLQGKTWHQAIAEDWRISGSWQPGWIYHVEA